MLIGFYADIQAQKVEKQEVDSLWWKQKTEQLDYSEEKLKSKDFDFEMTALPAWLNSPVLKFGILILITFVLLFVLYKLFGKGLFVNDLEEDKSANHLLTESNLDDRFYQMDLDAMLKKSIDKQDWAMAIRIRFLIVLKLMIDQKQIYWHRDLTNRQIAWQIKHKQNRNDFYKLTGFFEQAWYGNVPVSAAYYQEVSPMFENYNRPTHQDEKE